MEGHSFHIKISGGRRVVLPSEACKRLNVDVGDTVVVDVMANAVRVRSLQAVIADVRREAAKYVRPGESLVDELIRERREEAARE